LSATEWIGEAIGQHSAFLSAGFPALCAGLRESCAIDLTPRGHCGNDPGEGTIKARHLQSHWPWARAVLGVLHRVDGGGVVGRNQERKTAELLPHSQSFDESREMRGDRTCEGVVLVLQASSNCPQRNPSRMLVRGMRSVTVLMNAAVDQTGCAFRSDIGRFPHSASAPCGTAPQVPRRFPCHGLPRCHGCRRGGI
jgi:hypothetical protein